MQTPVPGPATGREGLPELEFFPTPEARSKEIREYKGGAEGWGWLIGIVACLGAAAASQPCVARIVLRLSQRATRQVDGCTKSSTIV